MRADRLISILLLLQAYGTLTAQELALRLEVSRRTVYRDIEALSIAGVPIHARPGTDGGLLLDEGYRVSLNGISRPEMQALLISGASGPVHDLGLVKASADLTLKLLAALPEMLRDEAGRIRQRIYIDPESWFEEAEPLPCLPVLQQAVWQDQVVCLHYQHGDGVLVERTVEAYALVAKANHWYLLGRPLNNSHSQDGELHTYRVARVQSAQWNGGTFYRPLDFDLPGYWQQHARDFIDSIAQPREPYEVLVRVRTHSLWLFVKDLSGRYTREAGQAEGEWVCLRVKFPSLYAAQMRVLSLGQDVEVLGPAVFRTDVIHTLEAALKHYAA